jgi:hypothetical protein
MLTGYLPLLSKIHHCKEENGYPIFFHGIENPEATNNPVQPSG